MNLNTGKTVMRGRLTPAPLTKLVKDKVESMARKQGITAVKFTNKAGFELPNTYWTPGIDYDEYLYQENNTFEGENDSDEEYEQDSSDDDELYDEEEDIDENELDDILADNGEEQE